MTDPVIEEIYLIVEAALNNGQKSVPFHSFPYLMIKKFLAPGYDKWGGFWVNELAPVYYAFFIKFLRKDFYSDFTRVLRFPKLKLCKGLVSEAV